MFRIICDIIIDVYERALNNGYYMQRINIDVANVSTSITIVWTIILCEHVYIIYA